MTSLYKMFVSATLLVALVFAVSCSSEAPETSKLYTDAKQMWDDFNGAFSMAPNSQERITRMNQILDEEWDVKIVANLEQYLKDAPSGKHAKEAKALLEQAKSSDAIRIMGQARPTLKSMGGMPKTAADVDSLTKKAEAMRQPGATDTTGADTTGK